MVKQYQINEMIEIILESSRQMPNYVFQYYSVHGFVTKSKPIFNLIADSFLTLFSYCLLIRESAWSQAFAVLRIGLEQVAAVFVICNVYGASSKYLDLIKEKAEYLAIEDDGLKRCFLKSKGISTNNRNAYFDYSWISSFTNDHKYGRKELLGLARLYEFQVDIEETLNAFSHGSISIFQMDKDNWDVLKRYARRACLTCCKLYDFLCCSYHLLIGKEEFNKLPLNASFLKFKTIYNDIFAREGWN